jgi:type IV pilus assembly protein PilB
MSKLLSLSPEHFSADALPATGTGAAVRLELLDGRQLGGELRTFQASQQRCVIRAADADADTSTDTSVPFVRLRWLRFELPLESLRARQGKAESFDIQYQDQGRLQGNCHEFRQDATGLHLLVGEDDDTIRRMFVPLAAVDRYRVGDFEGQGGPLSEVLAVNDPSAPVKRSQDLLARFAKGRGNISRGLDQATLQTGTAMGRSPRELAVRLGVPLVELRDFDVDVHALSMVPEEFARTHLVLPLLMLHGRLVVAMCNPADPELLSMLHLVSGRSVDGVVAEEADLYGAIDRYYGVREDNGSLQELESVAQRELELNMPVQEVERLGKEKPVVRLVNSIMLDAIHRGASDIHLRPGDKKVELLFRQDGTLVHVRELAKMLLPAVVARIKILGRMNIAERRLPQDGRARMVERGQIVDMRISVIPTVDGESVVIRLLNASAGLRTIGELGFNPHDAEAFTDLLHKSYGMLLVTGPTGSGKSTTLYAALQEVKKQNLNIITIEDPVEYHIDQIQQIQVNTAPGFTFARALRNILRHDPDVVMVGEIRDQETAKIAVESALTGHLVLSTLHTNDAPTTVTRLIEMGVESFLVKSSLLGVLAQRLVRLNCPQCKAPEPVDALMRKALGVPAEEKFFQSTGCPECNQTGFHGRKAVYELLLLTPALRTLLSPTVAADVIREQAARDGMVPLTTNAIELARSGQISLAEAYRVRLE